MRLCVRRGILAQAARREQGISFYRYTTMGAEQSSTRAAGGGPAGRSPRKTCYYELLGLDRQATDDE